MRFRLPPSILRLPVPGQQPSLFRAPSSVPDVLPPGTGDVDFNADQTLTGSRVVQSSSGSESEDDQHSVTGSLLEGNYRNGSPDR